MQILYKTHPIENHTPLSACVDVGGHAEYWGQSQVA